MAGLAERRMALAPPHASRDFESELRELRAQTLAMGARCERALRLAMQAFWEGSGSTADEVAEIDRHIDRDEMDVDALTLRMLALRQPVAHDLRLLTGTLRLVTDLERIGDEAVNIAERAARDPSAIPASASNDLKEMADHAQRMVRGALDSLSDSDPAKAEKVMVDDDAVDDFYARIVRMTTEFIGSHAEQGAEAIRIIQVAKYLERIADHATNVAEDVIFIVRGDDVRHKRSNRPPKRDA